jgi:hypothetical protein
MQARCVGHGTLVTAPLEPGWNLQNITSFYLLDDELTITDMSLYDKSSNHMSVGLIPSELVLYKQKGKIICKLMFTLFSQ